MSDIKKGRGDIDECELFLSSFYTELRSDCVQRLKDKLISYRQTSSSFSLESVGIDIDQLVKHILASSDGVRDEINNHP